MKEEEKKIQSVSDDELENVVGGAAHVAIRYHCHTCGDDYDNPGQCPVHPWVQLEKHTVVW